MGLFGRELMHHRLPMPFNVLQLIQQQEEELKQEEEYYTRLYLLLTLTLGVLEHQTISCQIHDWSHPGYDYGKVNKTELSSLQWLGCRHWFILEGPGHFAERWDCTPIPRADVSSCGEPRLGGGALGLTLHYLGSAILEVQLQQIFAIVPSVLARYLDFSLDILLATDLIVSRHNLLEGAFANIDGLSLLAQTSDDPEIENATYNGWKMVHRISNILMFLPKGTIIGAVLNAPGSWHDAHTARPIFDCLHTQVPEGYFVISDTAFPQGPIAISGKIKVPLKGGEWIPADPDRQEVVMRFNQQLLSFRQSAEWDM
ncbi:hypothetical protein D9758_009737 [Tetrapyrgos nigripes]|uniref:DDE Tnp4 domain-containing protein n=1 Tax=Tetrapyrgos nigripes TaxID=182062 RepID=A0A8H5GJZ2_9AGAR|nr:hypothetical protein D9758_009737 [Tetrapyrgos nigripes]